LVESGDERVTVLLGKYEIFDAAQYGSQRLKANVVVPVAFFTFHVFHFVAVSAAFPSAQEMTNELGFKTVFPVQLKSFVVERANGTDAAAEIGLAPAAAPKMTKITVAITVRWRVIRIAPGYGNLSFSLNLSQNPLIFWVIKLDFALLERPLHESDSRNFTPS
jgi:hypothetical protein